MRSPAFAVLCRDTYEANVVYNHPFIKKIIEWKSIGSDRECDVFLHSLRPLRLMIDEGAINQQSASDSGGKTPWESNENLNITAGVG